MSAKSTACALRSPTVAQMSAAARRRQSPPSLAFIPRRPRTRRQVRHVAHDARRDVAGRGQRAQHARGAEERRRHVGLRARLHHLLLSSDRKIQSPTIDDWLEIRPLGFRMGRRSWKGYHLRSSSQTAGSAPTCWRFPRVIWAERRQRCDWRAPPAAAEAEASPTRRRRRRRGRCRRWAARGLGLGGGATGSSGRCTRRSWRWALSAENALGERERD